MKLININRKPTRQIKILLVFVLILPFFNLCTILSNKESSIKKIFFQMAFAYFLSSEPSPIICDPTQVTHVNNWTIPRRWIEQNLAAIRVNLPLPTRHARNLFHVSAAMYDAWAAYDTNAKGWLFTNKYNINQSDKKRFREASMAFAAFRILTYRYKSSSNSGIGSTVISIMTTEFKNQCYNPNYFTQDETNPHAIGNLIAANYINFGLNDGSNETNTYADTTDYSPKNPSLIVKKTWTEQFLNIPPGNDELTFKDPNAWQEISFDSQVTQNGIPLGASTQEYVSPNWDEVAPFALIRPSGGGLYIDPGAPPRIDLNNNGIENETAEDSEFTSQVVDIITYSSKLDPTTSTTIDISPSAMGNNTLGANDGTGHALNPHTGSPYPSNLVKEADFGRVLAEFWADGPKSETPPGHWFAIANTISDDSMLEKKFEGITAITDRMEWDAKLYFALGGAVHDAAIVAWGLKRKYTSTRPITSIRRMGALARLPVTSGLIQNINPTTRGIGGTLENAGFTSADDGCEAIFTWAGQPADPVNQTTGAKWIRADKWLPYQRNTFVTPAFPGFVSGHSTFSRAAAEVLTSFTGSEFFPGGIYSHAEPANTGLEFEKGPSTDITLQWATYFDAADQAGISRLWGGIHVKSDDLEGRKAGSVVGKNAFTKAKFLFNQN
ncbi:MAG: vanadium-dependent haloperoxidase [Leptospiraceae bacterium]|nr:vanadium-dependent haloperoxidase [Leptospiraceae bacterium]